MLRPIAMTFIACATLAAVEVNLPQDTEEILIEYNQELREARAELNEKWERAERRLERVLDEEIESATRQGELEVALAIKQLKEELAAKRAALTKPPGASPTTTSPARPGVATVAAPTEVPLQLHGSIEEMADQLVPPDEMKRYQAAHLIGEGSRERYDMTKRIFARLATIEDAEQIKAFMLVIKRIGDIGGYYPCSPNSYNSSYDSVGRELLQYWVSCSSGPELYVARWRQAVTVEQGLTRNGPSRCFGDYKKLHELDDATAAAHARTIGTMLQDQALLQFAELMGGQ